MKILSAAQIREADKYTIEHEPIASIDLMERAAGACFKWIAARFSFESRFSVFCGTGNNGGDGLAIARMLHASGYEVKVFIITAGKKVSDDFAANEKKLRSHKKIPVSNVNSLQDIEEIQPHEIIIDAMFGTGLSKPVTGICAEVIHKINASNAKVIAIDMPSGLFADESSLSKDNAVIKATCTLSFQRAKLAFFFAENAEFTGEIVILSIGLNEKFISNLQSNYSVIEESEIRKILIKRKPFSHKGDYGHAGVVAGSYGKMGAAVLATRACIRSGAGLTTAIIPACGYEIMQIASPEAMCLTPSIAENENPMIISASFNTDIYDAMGTGPGIGKSKDAAKAIAKILQHFKKPLVLDADALNIISDNKELLKLLPPQTILTPHPKEFERLAGESANQFERNKKQIEFSKNHNVIIILKGKYSCISTPEGKCFFNPTGNPGMAKGGSGDVLTGIITGLLAQKYSPSEAAIAGTFIHGLAGDMAEKKKGSYSVTASDIVFYLSRAIGYLLLAD